MNGVVPLAVERVRLQFHARELRVRDAAPFRIRRSSSRLRTAKPAFVVVAAMRFTITWWVINGLPRQFCVMKENRRCSILFHLLVPGGK